MGRIAIRRVTYTGKKYYFESPILNDGINIIEGLNGRGKSTFMNLIYYGLGGRVTGFEKHNKEAKNKHNEIYNDSDNYVELIVEIKEKKYELTRHIGQNTIFVLDENGDVFEKPIVRRGNEDVEIFSDWMLSNLGIEVFDIIQGIRSFKINLNDLLRLIYHDQVTEVDRIYKEADNTNFLTDSEEIRKAIFEILIGKTYNDYYAALGAYKISQKKYEELMTIMESYNVFLREIFDDQIENVVHIQGQKKSINEMLEKLDVERNIALQEKASSNTIYKIIDEQQLILNEYVRESVVITNALASIRVTIDKVLYLINEAEKELKEIEKIRFVNKKLNLFTPNTCPYCLCEVERKENKCICGNEVDDVQYEKFFYTDEEYLEIIRVKKKSIQSLKELLSKKKERIASLSVENKALETKILEKRQYIKNLSKDIASEYNTALVRQLDRREAELNITLSKLTQAEELAKKRELIAGKLYDLKVDYEKKKNLVESLYSQAREDMLKKKQQFDKLYLDLMTQADAKCHSAFLGDDYMPRINFDDYRERSASVPKRLMYFLTLLLMSIKSDSNYPKLLLIDTPNKEGIDKEKLISNIALLAKCDEFSTTKNEGYQIILTTGIDTYPEELNEKVLMTLDDTNYLLKEKSK